MAGQGAHNKIKTRCKNGHPYDEDNTMYVEVIQNHKRYTVRQCKQCHKDVVARSRALRMKERPCDDCGEVGRFKAHVSKGIKHRYFCHDEEKSCYNYRRGNYFEDVK